MDTTLIILLTLASIYCGFILGTLRRQMIAWKCISDLNPNDSDFLAKLEIINKFSKLF